MDYCHRIILDPIFRQAHLNPFDILCDLWILWTGILGRTRNHSLVAFPAIPKHPWHLLVSHPHLVDHPNHIFHRAGVGLTSGPLALTWIVRPCQRGWLPYNSPMIPVRENSEVVKFTQIYMMDLIWNWCVWKHQKSPTPQTSLEFGVPSPKITNVSWFLL